MWQSISDPEGVEKEPAIDRVGSCDLHVGLDVMQTTELRGFLIFTRIHSGFFLSRKFLENRYRCSVTKSCGQYIGYQIAFRAHCERLGSVSGFSANSAVCMHPAACRQFTQPRDYCKAREG